MMISDTPLISVLIPMYNHSSYIEECLNSLVQQDYSNVEIVVCNDGSTDDSQQVLEKWVSENPSINIRFYEQKNMGVCYTLNRLVGLANGVYIALCASDDLLTSDSLSVRYRYLKEQTKGAVVSDSFTIDSESNIVNDSSISKLYRGNLCDLSNDIVSECVYNWAIAGPALLIERELYNTVGMYDESLLAEDRDFYLRLLAGNHLTFINQPLALYRVHSDNVSRSSVVKRLRITEDIALSNIKNSHSFDGFKKLFLLSHKMDLFLIKLLGKNNPSFFIISLFRALRYYSTKIARYFKLI